MSEPTEREDYENLLRHPGWLRLASWAKEEWNQQLSDLVARAAGERDDLAALTKLRQVIAARDAVRVVLDYPTQRAKQLKAEEEQRRQPQGIGRRGPL